MDDIYYMKEALKGAAKTKEKSSFGKPDFHIEKYEIPIVIEDKLGVKHHIAENKSGDLFAFYNAEEIKEKFSALSCSKNEI